jgi:hypothetical protein
MHFFDPTVATVESKGINKISGETVEASNNMPQVIEATPLEQSSSRNHGQTCARSSTWSLSGQPLTLIFDTHHSLSDNSEGYRRNWMGEQGDARGMRH